MNKYISEHALIRFGAFDCGDALLIKALRVVCVLQLCVAQLDNRVLVLFVMVCDELMAQSLNSRNHYIIQFSIFYNICTQLFITKINGNVYKIIFIVLL